MCLESDVRSTEFIAVLFFRGYSCLKPFYHQPFKEFRYEIDLKVIIRFDLSFKTCVDTIFSL